MPKAKRDFGDNGLRIGLVAESGFEGQRCKSGISEATTCRIQAFDTATVRRTTCYFYERSTLMQKRLSLADLKAKDKSIDATALLDSIKGGVLNDCHRLEA